MDQEEVLWVGDGHKMLDLAPFFWQYRRLLSQVDCGLFWICGKAPFLHLVDFVKMVK